MGEAEAWAARWQALAVEAFREVTAWRRQHPRATWRMIELAMDERLVRLRAPVLQDTALASPLAALRAVAAEERPAGPRGGGRGRPRGQHRRPVTTAHAPPLVRERSDAEGPAGGARLCPPG